MVNLKRHQKSVHEVVRYLSNFATMKQLQREIFKNTESQCMKKSNTLANFAVMKQLQKEIFNNTKCHFMKESNTLSNVAAKMQHKRDILRTPEGLYM